MTRILWHSNVPWSPTGYGQQTAQVVTRMKQAGHDVAIASNWGLMGAPLMWGDDITVYPAAESWEKVRTTLPEFVKLHGRGDPRDTLVITLADVFVLTQPALREYRVGAWTPVDHKPCPPRNLEFFTQTNARPIAMSRFGEQELRAAGLDPLYVPHGVETGILAPHPDRRALREQLGLNPDAFIVGMVANNQGTSPPRKAFPQVFEAFAEVRRKHDDAILFLHTDMVGRNQGVNLYALADLFKIPPQAMGWTDQTALVNGGLAAGQMASLYGAFDVLASPSYGEGFGIPIVEAQACGTPVIVTDWTSMPELCGSGWVVDGERWYDAHHGAFFKAPAAGEIAGAMLDAYEKRGDMDVRGAAREFALAYDADRVFREFWVPAIEALDAPREVGPITVNGNRAARRAKAKAVA